MDKKGIYKPQYLWHKISQIIRDDSKNLFFDFALANFYHSLETNSTLVFISKA